MTEYKITWIDIFNKQHESIMVSKKINEFDTYDSQIEIEEDIKSKAQKKYKTL